MHLIAGDQSQDDPVAAVKSLKPHSFHRQGEVVDEAFQNGNMDEGGSGASEPATLEMLVGVANHKPEVIELIEEQGWESTTSPAASTTARGQRGMEKGSQRRNDGNDP